MALLHKSIKKNTWIFALANKEPKLCTTAMSKNVQTTRIGRLIANIALTKSCTAIMHLLESPKRYLLFTRILLLPEQISTSCMEWLRKSFKFTVLSSTCVSASRFLTLISLSHQTGKHSGRSTLNSKPS